MGEQLRLGLFQVLLVVTPLNVIAISPPIVQQPEPYSATARISVQDTGPKTACDAPCPHCSAGNPYFMRTQIEILRSKPILNEVAKRLNLATAWADNGEERSSDEIYRSLRKSVTIRNYPNTTMLEITVHRPDPNEAAGIANEIAGTYRDYRLDLLGREKRAALEQIEASLKQQQARVDAAEDVVQALRLEFGLPAESGVHTGVDPVAIEQIKADRLAAQKIMLEKESSLKMMAHLEEKDLISRAAFAANFDEPARKLVQQYRDLEKNLQELGTEYGPNHPELKRFRAQMNAQEKVLEERIATLNVLLTQITGAGGYLRGEKYQPFRAALAKLESERLIYKELESRFQIESALLEAEPRSPVEIISSAEPVP